MQVEAFDALQLSQAGPCHECGYPGALVAAIADDALDKHEGFYRVPGW